MDKLIRKEYLEFRRTFPGQLKNLVAILSVFTGLFFWIRDRNLLLAIPMAVMSPLFLHAPAFFYLRFNWLHQRYGLRLLKLYEFSFITIIVLSNSGSAYLFYLPYQFDIAVHFIENFLFPFLLVLWWDISRRQKAIRPYSVERIGQLIPFWGFVMGIGWEAYQFACDEILGSKMAWDSVQSKLKDSTSDFLGGMIGVALGTILLTLKYWPRIHPWLLRRGGKK